MNAGKDVYCEKPMVQQIDAGQAGHRGAEEDGPHLPDRQPVRQLVALREGSELIKQGAIGEVNMVEAWLDRNYGHRRVAVFYSARCLARRPSTGTASSGRPEASVRTAPALPLAELPRLRHGRGGRPVRPPAHRTAPRHRSLGPNRIYATGGMRYWKDGRDVPDVMLATMDYPAFNFALRVNFKSGSTQENFGFRFVGDEGTMTTSMNDLTLSKHPRETEPGYTVETFAKAEQQRSLAAYHEKYPPRAEALPSPDDVQKFATHMNVHLEHHKNFYNAVRTRKPYFEDGVFGAPCSGSRAADEYQSLGEADLPLGSPRR